MSHIRNRQALNLLHPGQEGFKVERTACLNSTFIGNLNWIWCKNEFLANLCDRVDD